MGVRALDLVIGMAPRPSQIEESNRATATSAVAPPKTCASYSCQPGLAAEDKLKAMSHHAWAITLPKQPERDEPCVNTGLDPMPRHRNRRAQGNSIVKLPSPKPKPEVASR